MKNLSSNDTSLCCRRYFLPVGPKELREDYEKWKKKEPFRWKEIELVYPMSRHLGVFKCTVGGKPTEEYQHHYSCKMLDKETGVCTIYDIRPDMCRKYPYDGVEEVKACIEKGCQTFDICNGIKDVEKKIKKKKGLRKWFSDLRLSRSRKRIIKLLDTINEERK